MSRVIMGGDIYKGVKFRPTFEWGTFSQYEENRIFIFYDGRSPISEIITDKKSPAPIKEADCLVAALDKKINEKILLEAIQATKSSRDHDFKHLRKMNIEDWWVVIDNDVADMGIFLGNIRSFNYKPEYSMPEHNNRLGKILARRMADE